MMIKVTLQGLAFAPVRVIYEKRSSVESAYSAKERLAYELNTCFMSSFIDIFCED